MSRDEKMSDERLPEWPVQPGFRLADIDSLSTRQINSAGLKGKTNAYVSEGCCSLERPPCGCTGSSGAAGDRHGDDMLAAGVAGLAAGVIAGAIVSARMMGLAKCRPMKRFRSIASAPVYYSGGDYGYRPVRQNRIQPWTTRLVPALRRPLRQLRSADRHLYRRLRQRAFLQDPLIPST